jgi:sterol desaturase/sphingolipid hydroxylase (fatty acid hydroxylase superfamily)
MEIGLGNENGEDYDYLTPLQWLFIAFMSTTCICTYIDIHPLRYSEERRIEYAQDKIPRKRLTLQDIQEIVPVVVCNLFVSALFLIIGWGLRMWLFGVANLNPAYALSNDLVEPWWWYTQLIPTLVVIYLISDCWFYHAHKFAHRREVFYWLHALHHEYDQPFALETMYCSVWEMMLLNLMAVVLGPWLLLPDVWTCSIWYCLAAVYVVLAHSGYRFTSMFSAEYHDLHHRMFNCNFGSQMWDYIYGTQCKKAS